MCKPHLDFSRMLSELCHQAFIDSMKKFNYTLSYKVLIWNVQYVRSILLLTGT